MEAAAMREAYFSGEWDVAYDMAQNILSKPWEHSTEALILANSVITSVFAFRSLVDN